MELVYVPCYYSKKLDKDFLNETAANLIRFKKIGIFTTVQFLPQIEQLGNFLKKKGKKVFLAGQVLGCNPQNPAKVEKQVDCFVYLGSGKFHPIAVALNTSKPIIIANPLTKEVSKLDDNERISYLRVRERLLKRAANAETFGILVSTKPGQSNFKIARQVQRKIQNKTKKSYVFVFETLNPESLLDFPDIQAWINTACPRIAIDDFERFDRPVINAEEFLNLEVGLVKY